MKREDNDRLSEVLLPETGDVLQEEDSEYDEDDTERYEKNSFLRQRLRQYLLQKELDSIRNEIEDDDYGDNDEWLMSKLSPQFDNIYSGSELHFFSLLTK